MMTIGFIIAILFGSAVNTGVNELTKPTPCQHGTQNASSGDNTKNASSGDYTKNEITGKNSIVCDCGLGGQIKAVNGTPIAFAYFRDGEPVRFVTGVIGKDGLKENVWYRVSDAGEFEEVKP